MPEQSHLLGAVFISYCSQDAPAAERICEALRTIGLDVWLDKNELRGGDAWDAQIRKRIHDCALFIPVISANTNARNEGYFRREWKQATRRLQDMADDMAFLVPVVVDETREADARVPEEFLSAQWTWLRGGETPPVFAQRVRQLLGGDRPPARHAQSATSAHEPSARQVHSARPRFPFADRGKHHFRRVGLAVVALLLALGGGVFWYYQDTSDAPSAELISTAASAAGDLRPSIAVLPFTNRSEVKGDTYFVDGVHDDILTQLSKISSLRVISRTSVERFRKSQLSIKQIAEQLGVASILEGGVQRAGETVRINVQLIDARHDTHLWADSYDRKLTSANMFEIQSEIANAIAGALKTSLKPEEQRRLEAIPTRSLPAWQHYQLGKQSLVGRNSASLAKAEAQFRQAVALDPAFALAWVGLSDALALQAAYAGLPLDSVIEESEQAVARALKLNPDLAEAWASAGNIANSRFRFEDAEQKLKRAIALNPNYSTAYQWLSLVLRSLGRQDEALIAAERAVALDPLSAIINANLGDARAAVGRFGDALDAYAQTVAIDPTMPGAYSTIGQELAWSFGRYDLGAPWLIKAVELDPGNPYTLTTVGYVFWELGDNAAAEQWLVRARAITEEDSTFKALTAAIHLDRKEDKLARKYALEAAGLDAVNLFLITDFDLRAGAYAEARARYLKAFPELFETKLPPLNFRSAQVIVDLALVLQHTGEERRAKYLLDHGEMHLQTLPRMSFAGYGISDVKIHALRGEKPEALAKLREAERAGWRFLWRYERDRDLSLASIRNEPEFKAIFADIEQDMAQQRASLAARPEDAPLELTNTRAMLTN